MARDFLDQLLTVQRLGDEAIHAGRNTALALVLHHTGRHRQHRQVQPQFTADQGNRLKPSITGIWMSNTD